MPGTSGHSPDQSPCQQSWRGTHTIPVGSEAKGHVAGLEGSKHLPRFLPGNPGIARSLHSTASCSGQGPGWPWNLLFHPDSDQSLGSYSWVHSHPKAQPHLDQARTVMPVATHPRCPGSPRALHIFLGI